jgi:hypothetical protein
LAQVWCLDNPNFDGSWSEEIAGPAFFPSSSLAKILIAVRNTHQTHNRHIHCSKMIGESKTGHNERVEVIFSDISTLILS